MMPHSSAPMVVDYQNGKGPGKEDASMDVDGQSPVSMLLCNSKKLQDDLESLGLKIKQHEDNLGSLNAEKTKLDHSILDRQGKYHSSTKGDGDGVSGTQTSVGTIQQILHHDKSAASLLCQLEPYHAIPPSNIPLTKDVLGVVANLGKVADANLSRLLSEYLGVDTMLAVVFKNFEGVKALERYDEHGQIDKSSGLHELGAAVGKHLHGRFHIICLEDLRSYVGEFLPNDPQRRLDLLKPRMRNGELPPGFLDFAVNTISLDPSQLNYFTTDGQGLRETLFYSLFRRTQVYKTRAEMFNALPFIVDGAISLDGGIIRSPGVYHLGDREEALVQFSVVSERSSLPSDCIEIVKEMKKLKWKREKLMEEMQREQLMLDQAKRNFESKKQEFVRFLQQAQSYESQTMPSRTRGLHSASPVYCESPPEIEPESLLAAASPPAAVTPVAAAPMAAALAAPSLAAARAVAAVPAAVSSAAPPADGPGQVNLGPIDRSLLRLQERHRSQNAAADTVEQPNNDVRWRSYTMWPLDPLTRKYVEQAGFGAVADISPIRLDPALLHALVERWRPETHTFHLRWGEMTITLQDVQVLFGLRVGGLPLTDTNIPSNQGIDYFVNLCRRLLGETPSLESKDISGDNITLSWLSSTFKKTKQDHDWHPPSDEAAQMRARAYIIHMLGGFLFSTTGGNRVSCTYLPFLEDLAQTAQYSWGSAVLSYLYRSLCSASCIGKKVANGCGLLLQLWSWEHLHLGRPSLPDKPTLSSLAPLGVRWREPSKWKKQPMPRLRQFYRDELVVQGENQVNWTPYTEERLKSVPAVCIEKPQLWRAKVPMIHFNNVEWHMPDRVLRQFGLNQHIPDGIDNVQEWDRLHTLRRVNMVEPWHVVHRQYVEYWNKRDQMVVNERCSVSTSRADYLVWYNRITRRFGNQAARRLPQGGDAAEPTMQFEPRGNQITLLMSHIKQAARIAKGAVRNDVGEAKTAVESILSICRSAHDVLGELGEFNQMIAQLEEERNGAAAAGARDHHHHSQPQEIVDLDGDDDEEEDIVEVAAGTSTQYIQVQPNPPAKKRRRRKETV